MSDAVHTIPVPRGWSPEQAWESIARDDVLTDPEPGWANVRIRDGKFVELVPSMILWPRYDVGGLSGYVFMRQGFRYVGGARGGTATITTTWYVYDRPFARRIVASFEGPDAEAEARYLARRKNGEYARWLRLNGHR